MTQLIGHLAQNGDWLRVREVPVPISSERVPCPTHPKRTQRSLTVHTPNEPSATTRTLKPRAQTNPALTSVHTDTGRPSLLKTGTGTESASHSHISSERANHPAPTSHTKRTRRSLPFNPMTHLNSRSTNTAPHRISLQNETWLSSPQSVTPVPAPVPKRTQRLTQNGNRPSRLHATKRTRRSLMFTHKPRQTNPTPSPPLATKRTRRSLMFTRHHNQHIPKNL